MSGYWISSEKEKRPLTVRELADFFNEIVEDYPDDYVAMDGKTGPWDQVLSYIQVSGLRQKGKKYPITTDWIRNPYLFKRVQCEHCNTDAVVRTTDTEKAEMNHGI